MVIFHSYVNLPEGRISSSQVPHYNYYSYIIVISLYHHDYCYTTIIKYMFPPKFPPLVDSSTRPSFRIIPRGRSSPVRATSGEHSAARCCKSGTKSWLDQNNIYGILMGFNGILWDFNGIYGFMKNIYMNIKICMLFFVGFYMNIIN